MKYNNFTMKHPETARRLSEALADRNMLPSELASKSGVSKASISQYVNGSHIPSNLSSTKMAEVLKVNPLWLMGFDMPKTGYSHEAKEDDSVGELIDIALGLDDATMQQLIDYAKYLSKEK